MTVALYQKGKEFVWEGLDLAMKIVTEAEVEAHKLLGWVMHPYDTIEVPASVPDAVVVMPEAGLAPAPESAQTVDEPAPAAAAVPNPFA